jgi:hypothetical protein
MTITSKASLIVVVGVAAATAAPDGVASTLDLQERGIGGLSYKAAPGERNRVTIRFKKGRFTFVDRGASISEREKRCRRLRAGVVRCRKPLTAAANLSVSLLDGNDSVVVTAARRRGFTTVHGGSGDDSVEAGSGAVNGLYFGDAGADRIVVGRSRQDSELEGGDGPDVLIGGPGADSVVDDGSGGEDEPGENDDRLEGRGGDDTVLGGRGNDVLLGGDGNDQLGTTTPAEGEEAPSEPGADQLDGGPGDDLLGGLDDPASQFGGGPEPDQITCGPGDDRAIVDQLDAVASDCEHVERMTMDTNSEFFGLDGWAR